MSRFEPKKPSSSPKRREDENRFSPVYAGRSIKPLKKLAFQRGRLQSRTGSRSSGKPENPCRTPAKTTIPPSFRAIPRGFPERNDLLPYQFSECEHERASESQHVRRGVIYPGTSGLPRAKFTPFQKAGRIEGNGPKSARISRRQGLGCGRSAKAPRRRSFRNPESGAAHAVATCLASTGH